MARPRVLRGHGGALPGRPVVERRPGRRAHQPRDHGRVRRGDRRLQRPQRRSRGDAKPARRRAHGDARPGATAFSGLVVIVALIGAFVYELATGGDTTPYARLAVLGGVAYLLALFVLQRRS